MLRLIVASMLAVGVTVVSVLAQPPRRDAVLAGSAEAKQRLQDFKDLIKDQSLTKKTQHGKAPPAASGGAVPLANIREEAIAASTKAAEMMKKAGASNAVKEWVQWYVGHGAEGLPKLSDQDLVLALFLLATPEVREWLRLEDIYVWENKRQGK